MTWGAKKIVLPTNGQVFSWPWNQTKPVQPLRVWCYGGFIIPGRKYNNRIYTYACMYYTGTMNRVWVGRVLREWGGGMKKRITTPPPRPPSPQVRDQVLAARDLKMRTVRSSFVEGMVSASLVAGCENCLLRILDLASVYSADKTVPSRGFVPCARVFCVFFIAMSTKLWLFILSLIL